MVHVILGDCLATRNFGGVSMEWDVASKDRTAQYAVRAHTWQARGAAPSDRDGWHDGRVVSGHART